MKLYTRNQLIASYNKGLMDAKDDIIDIDLVNNLTPIELPSDEEINYVSGIASGLPSYQETFIRGAKWVIEQIKQQDNVK